MNFSRTLAAGMEASDYFAPAITVIELAQEALVCISDIQQCGETDDLYSDTILDLDD